MSELLPRSYRLRLKPGRDVSVRRRHPWIYSGAVDLLEGLEGAEPGDLGEVLSAEGETLAVATVNPASQITARILRWDGEAVDRAWLAARLEESLALRRRLVDPQVYEAFRWVHGEGDGLSGLVVDLYGAYAVVQTVTLFWYRIREALASLLAEATRLEGVWLRTHGKPRDPQVPEVSESLKGEPPPSPLEVREGPVRLLADLVGGQKTGLYLDQRVNRVRLAPLAAEREVLVPFAYTGGFGLHAARAGARRVVLVESSRKALELAREAWRRNGLDPARLEVVEGDAWEILRRMEARFDLVVLDPPPLAKAVRHLPGALRGYKDINLQAFRRLRPEGWLATFSCSQHVDAATFQKTLFLAAADAGRRVRLVERLGAGPDHPVDLYHPQGEYLKGCLLWTHELAVPAEAGE
jgi:23S rRNA (cytosine1962-C5)-methyltransferase